MILPIITFISALFISLVAASYSIIGLTTLFSGAVYSVIIMGVALEIGKIVTATWLHENWKIAPFLLKSYLTAAVVVLMFITSMGIFGYLSKAHLTQMAPVSVIQTDISKIDLEIQQQKDLIIQEEKNIVSSQKIIEQLDKSMESYFERGIISKALKEREKQKLERDESKNSINNSNNLIKKYNEQISKLSSNRFDLEQKLKNIELEVGPIKYIADLVYGEQQDKNLLEKTVRFVILMLVFVFDPLAILMILASNISFKQVKTKKEIKNIVPEKETIKDEIEKIFFEPKEEKNILQQDNVIELENEIETVQQTKEDKIITKNNIEDISREIFEKMSSSPQISFNLSSGDNGKYIKKIIAQTIKNNLTPKE